MMLLEEMASIFLTPYLLLFVVPKRVDDILQFVADFTVNVEGVGHVCSFSLFDFQNHGNSNYGSPYNSPSMQRSSQGKMEKSILSFQSSYPTWEPNAHGKQFLVTLKKFRDQMLQGQGTRPAYSLPRMQQWTSNLRGLGDRNSVLSREMPYNIPGTGYQLGSVWMIDVDQKNYLYILDWYYTSRPHHATATDNSRDIPPGPCDVAEGGSRDFWMPPPHLPRNVTTDEDNQGHLFEDRAQRDLEASTSAPFFRESVLQHHDSSNMAHPTKSHWWARSRQHGVDPRTSFLEPPNFNQNTSNNYYDNFSDRGLEEEEQQFDWRNAHRLSQTYYVDDLEGGEFNLPFDDIYSRPPDSPSRSFDPTSCV